MKRVDLVRVIESFGCDLVRHGGKHDWYRNPATGVSQPIPRHREIKEPVARRIIKMLSPPADDAVGDDAADEDHDTESEPAGE